ncbi:hypothetical protein [Bifidobacterium parmae]|nr:hypothetical protein [Bifidobacterium parmae]
MLLVFELAQHVGGSVLVDAETLLDLHARHAGSGLREQFERDFLQRA